MTRLQYSEEKITPKRAKALLKTNNSNRGKSRANIEKYASLMSRGLWALNGETIILSGDGVLLNGQHRLEAIMLSEETVTLSILSGINPETFDTLDGGKKRSAADILTIRGYNSKEARALSAAARTDVAFDISGGFANTKKVTPYTTSDQVADIVEADDSFSKAFRAIGGYPTKEAVMGSAWLVFITRRMYKVDREFTESWLEGFLYGVGLQANDWRLWARGKIYAGNEGHVTMSQERRAYYMVKAWSLCRRGSTRKGRYNPPVSSDALSPLILPTDACYTERHT